MVGSSGQGIGIEAFAVLLSVGGEDSIADGVVDEGAAGSESATVLSTLGVGALVAGVDTGGHVLAPLVGEAGGDTSAFGAVTGEHVGAVGLGKDTVAIHEHAPVVVESGAEDVVLGIQDALVAVSLSLLEHGVVVSESVHAEASTLGDADSPEALGEFHVLGVGSVEGDRGHLLVEVGHDGVEGLGVLACGEAVQGGGDRQAVAACGVDEAVEGSGDAKLVLVAGHLGVALRGDEEASHGVVAAEQEAATVACGHVDACKGSADASRGAQEVVAVTKLEDVAVGRADLEGAVEGDATARIEVVGGGGAVRGEDEGAGGGLAEVAVDAQCSGGAVAGHEGASVGEVAVHRAGSAHEPAVVDPAVNGHVTHHKAATGLIGEAAIHRPRTAD